MREYGLESGDEGTEKGENQSPGRKVVVAIRAIK